MATIKQDAYLCLSAMLRARESRMLSGERARRMLDAPSFEDCAKLLTDCGYEDMSQMSAAQIEDALAARRGEIFSEMARLAPDVAVVDLFRMKYDYHNAKVLVKAEAMGTDPARLLSDSGRVPVGKLRAAFAESRFVELPGALGHALEEARAALSRTANPQLSDFVLDSACFAELRQIADESGSPFLQSYVQILIDSTNLKSAVRALRMGRDAAFLASVILPGGSISAERICAAGDREALGALFANGRLEKAAALAAAAAEGGSLTQFERACDNAVGELLREAKLVGFGCEPLAAYLAAVEGEISAARMILTGRLAGVESELIRERMRDLYA